MLACVLFRAESGRDREDWVVVYAVDTPASPAPMITTSVVSGSSGVERYESRR